MTQNTWHHIYVADYREAFTGSSAIQKQVLAAMLTGSPMAAVFSRLDREGGGTHFYFNPYARAVALLNGATPCPTPTLDQVGGLLVGDASSLDELAK